MDRRSFLTLLAAGVAGVLTGCSSSEESRTTGVNRAQAAAAGRMLKIPPPHPGQPHVVRQAPAAGQRIALTIDDGFSAECVDGYVRFAERTGIAVTFSPNGTYHDIWNRHAEQLRSLIERGQVQIGNHTWTHRNMLTRSDAAIRADIERNEEWIQRTFGITSRPYFRPPYGSHNGRTDALAGGLGYTTILMWNGTFGDAHAISPKALLAQAHRWLRPDAIVLSHANHPAVLSCFNQILDLLHQRHLTPVTLDTMFGTSRTNG